MIPGSLGSLGFLTGLTLPQREGEWEGPLVQELWRPDGLKASAPTEPCLRLGEEKIRTFGSQLGRAADPTPRNGALARTGVSAAAP